MHATIAGNERRGDTHVSKRRKKQRRRVRHVVRANDTTYNVPSSFRTDYKKCWHFVQGQQARWAATRSFLRTCSYAPRPPGSENKTEPAAHAYGTNVCWSNLDLDFEGHVVVDALQLVPRAGGRFASIGPRIIDRLVTRGESGGQRVRLSRFFVADDAEGDGADGGAALTNSEKAPACTVYDAEENLILCIRYL